MAQAGGMPVVFLTAYHLLRSIRPLLPGETVLVQAAASGVGTVLLQLCKQWALRSIATASTAAKLELARDLGADETINYATHDFEAEVQRLTRGAGVQLALDAVGGEVTRKSMRCLAPFGCLINYGNASNQSVELPLASFREQRMAVGFGLPSMAPRYDNQAPMAEMLDLMTAGKLRLVVDRVLPLSEAAEAHGHLANRGAMGKVLLALKGAGIEVTALHSHMLQEEPRLFFMHFWANDDALTLARGLRAALDRIEIRKEVAQSK